MTFGRIRHFARLVVLPLVVSLVAACTQTPGASNAPTAAASATPPGPAGSIPIAMRGDIQSPHPYLSYDIVGISYRENVFDALVEWGYDGKIVPGIAESWKVEGTTITFNIRKGVKFHNGDAVTADDVKFSLDTIKSKDLNSGSASFVQDLPTDQVDPLKAAGLNVVESKSPVYNWAFFNTASTSDAAKPLKDAKVRQAMNLAVDTATIIKTVLSGHARQLAAGITDLTDGYTSDLKPFAFDQAKAKSLLAEAGYPSGFSIDADISNTAKPDVAQAVIAQLGQVGIKVNLNALPTDVFNDRWIKKGLDPLYFVTWNTFTHPALLDLLAGCKGFISSFCNQDAQ